VQVPVKPVPKETVGEAGTVIPAGYTSVMVPAEVRAPEDDEVNPTLHVDGALAPVFEGVNDTDDKEVPVMT
jgi:hypothetical protein